MDRKKLEEWIAIQCRKGGPALDVLHKWRDELRPAPPRSLRDVLWDEADTIADLDAVPMHILPLLRFRFAELYTAHWGTEPSGSEPRKIVQHMEEDPRPRIHEKGGYARLHQHHKNPRRKK